VTQTERTSPHSPSPGPRRRDQLVRFGPVLQTAGRLLRLDPFQSPRPFQTPCAWERRSRRHQSPLLCHQQGQEFSGLERWEGSQEDRGRRIWETIISTNSDNKVRRHQADFLLPTSLTVVQGECVGGQLLQIAKDQLEDQRRHPRLGTNSGVPVQVGVHPHQTPVWSQVVLHTPFYLPSHIWGFKCPPLLGGPHTTPHLPQGPIHPPGPVQEYWDPGSGRMKVCGRRSSQVPPFHLHESLMQGQTMGQIFIRREGRIRDFNQLQTE